MSTDLPAAFLASRLVKAGHHDKFECWADRLSTEIAGTPGHRATVRLDQPGGLVHFVHVFDTGSAMRVWDASPDRARLTEAADRFSSGRPQIVDGPDLRADLPSETAVPKWKTFLATWTSVFPILLLLNTIVNALPVQMPMPIQLAGTSLILTATLTWIILPQVKKLLRPWLLAAADGGLRR